MENGDDTTFASPTAVDKAAPNGEEVTVADAVHPAKSYAAVAANAEIEDLRATKLDLDNQLATAANENKALAAEAHRLEGLFSQARDDVATAEHAAATTEAELSSLRAEVDRLQALLDSKKADDERQRQDLEAEVSTVRHAKLKLEEEIDALKASAAAAVTATVQDREAAPDALKAPKDAWQGVAAGAAAGAAVTAAVVLIYLRLKR